MRGNGMARSKRRVPDEEGNKAWVGGKEGRKGDVVDVGEVGGGEGGRKRAW